MPSLAVVNGDMLIAKHLPRGPKGQKRPADVIGNAVHVMRIATGEVVERPDENAKNAAAVELGRRGGETRARTLSAKRKAEIASNAAKARWARKRYVRGRPK